MFLLKFNLYCKKRHLLTMMRIIRMGQLVIFISPKYLHSDNKTRRAFPEREVNESAAPVCKMIFWVIQIRS